MENNKTLKSNLRNLTTKVRSYKVETDTISRFNRSVSCSSVSNAFQEILDFLEIMTKNAEQ